MTKNKTNIFHTITKKNFKIKILLFSRHKEKRKTSIKNFS